MAHTRAALLFCSLLLIVSLQLTQPTMLIRRTDERYALTGDHIKRLI